MARTSREKSCTGIYHVMMRGINRQEIFIDNEDKEKFLDFLHGATTFTHNISGRVAGQYEIYAYALMGNHFHLLANVISGELGELVKKLASGYVRYFNKKYNRDGHLYKERFKSEPCENFNYFTVLLRYIHQNPVKHGFAKAPHEYRFTSWKEYFAPDGAEHNICNVGYVLSKMTLEELKRTIVEEVPPNQKCLEIDQAWGQISDETLAEFVSYKYNIANPLELKGCNKDLRNEILKALLEYGGAVRQISRLTGIDKMVISRLK